MHLLENMTWVEIGGRIRNKDPLIFIVGSVEQHGPHLPVNTDTVIPFAIAQRVAALTGAVVAPPMAYGFRSNPKSGGGEGFCGTISLSGETVIRMVADALTGYIEKGFENIFVLHWHIENVEFVNEGVNLAVQATRHRPHKVVMVGNPNATVDPAILEETFEGDFPGWEREHAAIFETSLMLALRPDLVRQDLIKDDESDFWLPYDVIPLQKGIVPESGVLWHASKASAAKGEKILASMVEALAEIIRKEFRVCES